MAGYKRNVFFLILSSLIIMISGCKKNETTPDITTPKKWYVLKSQTNLFLSSVFFINSNSGFAVGSYVDNDGLFLHGMIFKTTDEGLNWSVTSPDTLPDLLTVYFTDTLTGYAAGTGCIIKTINGGKDWFTVLNDPEIHISSLFFPDKNTGFASGLFGRILKTTDAGESWQLLQSGTRCHLTSVYFTDELKGYAVGYWNEDTNLYGVLVMTTDGGNSWDSIPIPAGYTPEVVTFTHAETGYICGGNKILKTRDGGRNWDIIYTSFTGNLFSASFIRNSPTGYVVGQNGLVLKTLDAGVTWTPMTNSSNYPVNSVFVVNHNLAFFSAFDPSTHTGTLLKWE